MNKEKINTEKIESPTMLMIKKFKSNKLAMIGLISFTIILSLVLIATLYTKLSGYDFSEVGSAKDILENRYQSPSLQHLFGTDRYGRDYFIRVLSGGFISIQVGFLSVLISIIIGVSIGSFSGFLGGKVDLICMRVTELVSSFPFLAIAITASVVFSDYGEKAKVYIIVIIMGLLRWTGLARMVRGQILSIKRNEFITAAKALGLSKRKQVVKHLIPNVIAYVIVSATMTFASAILAEASLSYLGLSINEPLPTWGGLIQRASQSPEFTEYAWLWFFPGIFLFVLIMSINLIGEGLRDSIDPKVQVHLKKKSIFRRLKPKYDKAEIEEAKRKLELRGESNA